MDFYHINAHEFKYDTIQKYVTQPFLSVGIKRDQIFYAGFGNTVYDMHAYHNAGMDMHRMFLIDKKSCIFCLDSTLTTSDDSTRTCIQRALDHPKRYATVKGTLFSDGYDDPKLLTYLLNVNMQ
jgi:phosphatidate phosphatase PAH1